MERKIEKALSLKNENEVLRNDKKALDCFDNLIERGVAKPRGNNSFSLDQMGNNYMRMHNKFNNTTDEKSRTY